MSLVSVGNFAAPFRNRVHLITIILVTIVFATLRLSGASIEVRSTSDGKRAQPSSIDSSRSSTTSREAQNSLGRQDPLQQQRIDGEAYLNAQRAQQAKRADVPLSLGQNSQDDMIEDVMRPSAPPVARNRAAEQTQVDKEKSDGGSLSDIEKQLGLK